MCRNYVLLYLVGVVEPIDDVYILYSTVSDTTGKLLCAKLADHALVNSVCLLWMVSLEKYAACSFLKFLVLRYLNFKLQLGDQ